MAVAGSSGKGAALASSRSGFVALPLEVVCHPDLGDGAFRTYCVLRHYCFGRRTYCWPSMRTLARDRACSEETIRRHLRDLVAAGLVRIDKRGRGNVYRFPDDHMFWAADTSADAPTDASPRTRAAASPEPKPAEPSAVKKAVTGTIRGRQICVADSPRIRGARIHKRKDSYFTTP